MDRMWAPWRKAYIRPRAKKSKKCLFCSVRKRVGKSHHFIIARSSSSFAILNIYPYNNGHVMVVPNRHLRRIREMTKAEKLDWLELTEDVIGAIEKTMRPHGFNLGINLGRAGGAGIPGHLHFHVVPRWEGDSNFMPILGGTKVISESLESVYQNLKKEIRKRKSYRV